jgi:hypothetical protein
MPPFKIDFWRANAYQKARCTAVAAEIFEASHPSLFAQVVADYELDEHHLRLLTLAGEAWDRGQQARTEIEKFGITYVDRFGAPRKRPEVSIEAESRISFARILREIDLSVEPPSSGTRLPALHSNRRQHAS